MRTIAVFLLVLWPVGAFGQNRASSNDEITRALGANSWNPLGTRPNPSTVPSGNSNTKASEVIDPLAHNKCHLEINGTVLINGQCSINTENIYNFYNGKETHVVTRSAGKTEWFIAIRQTNRMSVIWNGKRGLDTASYALGDVHKTEDRCISNNVVKFCWYPLNTALQETQIGFFGEEQLEVSQNSIPYFDVENNCEYRWNKGAAMQRCINNEQSYYDLVKSYWDRVDHDVQRECARHGASLEYENYAGAWLCANRAMSERDATRPKRFKY